MQAEKTGQNNAPGYRLSSSIFLVFSRGHPELPAKQLNVIGVVKKAAFSCGLCYGVAISQKGHRCKERLSLRQIICIVLCIVGASLLA
jgi:hypothetical protein